MEALRESLQLAVEAGRWSLVVSLATQLADLDRPAPKGPKVTLWEHLLEEEFEVPGD